MAVPFNGSSLALRQRSRRSAAPRQLARGGLVKLDTELNLFATPRSTSTRSGALQLPARDINRATTCGRHRPALERHDLRCGRRQLRPQRRALSLFIASYRGVTPRFRTSWATADERPTRTCSPGTNYQINSKYSSRADLLRHPAEQGPTFDVTSCGAGRGGTPP